MAKKQRKKDRKKPSRRTLIQLCAAAVSNGYAAGFASGSLFKGKTKMLCVPGLNCYSCPGALGSCPIGSLQAVLADRKYKFSFYVVGILAAFGAVFGRFICGWLCPFGLVQDLLYKIPIPKKRKKLPGDRYLQYLRYAVLAVFVIILPLAVLDSTGQGQPWFCKWICPSGTLFAGFPLIGKNPEMRQALGGLFGWKTALLLAVILLSIVVYRPFCRYLCPLGAFYGLFNSSALLRHRLDKEKCVHCGACQKSCKLDIRVWEKPNSTQCIRCGDCLKSCPTGALTGGIRKKADGSLAVTADPTVPAVQNVPAADKSSR